MRLTEEQANAIVHAVRRRFGSEAAVYLFGSRTDNEKRGGDIDLLVETDLEPEAAFRAKIDAVTDIQLAIGERKIDLVTTRRDTPDQRPIVREARREAVKL